MQLATFFGANGKQTDNGRDNTAGADHDRSKNCPQHVAAHEVTAQCAQRSSQDDGSQDGARVGLKQVSTHASNVTYVVAYIVGDCSRVAGVVFRNTSFNFSNQVSAYVSGLGVDTATNTGKQSNCRSTGGEAFNHTDVVMQRDHQVRGDSSSVQAEQHAVHQSNEPQGKTEQCERSNAQTHGQTRLEAHVQSLGNRLFSCMSGAGVSARCNVHAHVTSSSGQNAARNEGQSSGDGQSNSHNHSNNDHKDDEQLVFAHQEGLSALLDFQRNAVHFFGARILLQNPRAQVSGHADANNGTDGGHDCYISTHLFPPLTFQYDSYFPSAWHSESKGNSLSILVNL